MTDKERLNLLKNDVYINAVNNGMKRTTIGYEEACWLIEQAEKNMTCRQEVLDLQKDALKGLLKQNKRYREALEFYADGENFKPKHFDPETVEYTSTIDYDKGQTAREALEESE